MYLKYKNMLFLDCECNSVGSVSQVCDKESGNCTCKSKYSGRTCNQCEAGYYEYPTCKRKSLIKLISSFKSHFGRNSNTLSTVV